MTDPNGRLPIGLAQPPYHGAVWPFAREQPELKRRLADFFLHYRDTACGIVAPLSIRWLAGFGEDAVAPISGYPTPTHAYDLIVVDAEDTVVFDSTQATTYRTWDWGTRLLVIEWALDAAICRATIHTEWSPDDVVETYDTQIELDDGELDGNTWVAEPLRVTSFQIGSTVIPAGPVKFKAGNNMALALGDASGTDGVVQASPTATTTSDGARRSARIQFSAIPGAGLGRVLGCEDDPPLVSFGGAKPTSTGYLTLDMSDCLRMQQPLRMLTDVPRVFERYHPDVPADEYASTIQLGNNCPPCCECEDFVKVYNGIKRQWFLGQEQATRAQAIGATHARNIERWEAQKSCRENNPVRYVALAELGCRMGNWITICNTSQCCIYNVTLRITFQTFDSQGEIAKVGSLCGPAYLDGPFFKFQQPYALGGFWPVYTVTLPYITSQANVALSFRSKVGSCATGETTRATATVHFDSPDDDRCTYPTASVPSDIQDLWAFNAMPSISAARWLKTANIPLDPRSIYLGACSTKG